MNPVIKRAAWRSLAFLLAVGVALFPLSAAAGADAVFEGEISTWHDGFARFDYLMDDETLGIQPFKRGADERYGIKDPPPGKHRCVVIVPKQPALGNPWSWRGCYWDHQPQTEVPMLHVCGSLDPLLQQHTRAAEARCKELGGVMTIIIQEGIGHYPTAPRDPTPVVEFILRQQQPKSARRESPTHARRHAAEHCVPRLGVRAARIRMQLNQSLNRSGGWAPKPPSLVAA